MAEQVNFDQIHPETTGMAKDLIDRYTENDMKKATGDVGPIYKWCTEVIERMEEDDRSEKMPEEPRDSVQRQALRIEKQKKIFKK